MLYTMQRISNGSQFGVPDSYHLTDTLYHESISIRLSTDAVCYDVYRFYRNYIDETFDIFSINVILDPPLQNLCHTSVSSVTYVTGRNFSR